MAALLIAGPGAHLSHQTAAQLWGWPGFRPPVPIVQRRKSSNRRQLTGASVIETLDRIGRQGRRGVRRVDFLIDSRVVLEVLGDRFHTGLAAREDDRARFDAIVAAGFSLVTITEADVFTGPHAWIGRVLAALRRPAAA